MKMYTEFIFISEFITAVSRDSTVSKKASFSGCALDKMAWAGRRRARDK